MTKTISDVFDVDHPPNRLVDNIMKNYEPTVIESSEVMVHQGEEDSDIKLAQDNLKDLMKITKDAITEAMDLAMVSEQPRAWEVVTGMISASAELSDKLIGSHATKQKMKRDAGGKSSENTGGITNNNLFVGTPNELAKLLKGQNGTI